MDILNLDLLQWSGCIVGCGGAFLIALNIRISGWGFVLFLLANMIWIVYGIKTGAMGLVMNQIFFTATSLIGIYRWLFYTAKKDSFAP